LRKVQTKVTIDRILVALEEPSDERLVDDGDRLRGLVVGGREMAAPNELHAEVLEVVRADTVPRRAGLLVGLRLRVARHQHELAPVVRQRVVEREAGSLYSWQTGNPLFHAAI